MKQFLNYLQIAVLVNNVELGLPDWIRVGPKLIGSPVDTMKSALDCPDFIDEDIIPKVYIRVVGAFCLIIILLIINGLMYMISNLINKKN